VRLVAFPARPPLDAYVELFWFVRGRPDYEREKVLPNGVIELIFNLGQPHKVVDANDPTRSVSFFDAWLAGLQERFLVIQAHDDFDLIGIRFRPGGATPFLRFSPAELTNVVVETDCLDRAAAELIAAAREQLRRAPTLQGRVVILEDLLCRRIDRDWAPHSAVRSVLRELRRPAPSRIAALSQTARVSHKHLIDCFRTEVGTTPSVLLQIERFQRALRQVTRSSRVEWTDIAHASGYYDQAHMIRAFRRFAGATPSEYVRNRDADPNHIRLNSSNS
jgi:AraC-like DNA-binding protein